MGNTSAGGNASNASKNLLNQAQGLAGPGSPIMTGFQTSLGTAQGNQAGELSSAMSGIGNLQNIASTGGYDPTQLASTEGGYNTLATTGGYTPQQAQQFVQQATEGTQATYGALENQAKQASIATGGAGTGGGLSQMARQLSQAQGANTLNAEVALNQQQTGNKLAGLGGSAALQGNVASNTLQGTEAANNQLSQLYNTTTGQVTQLGNQVLSTLGLDFQTQDQAINALTSLSKNTPLWQSVVNSVVSAGGAAAGAYGAVK